MWKINPEKKDTFTVFLMLTIVLLVWVDLWAYGVLVDFEFYVPFGLMLVPWVMALVKIHKKTTQ